MSTKRPRQSPAKTTTVSAYDNVWSGGSPATLDDVKAVAQALGVKLPKELVDLLHSCSGARPAKPYFFSKRLRVEAHIGEILPLTDLPKRRGLITRTMVQRQQHGMPAELVPFATDNGNAGLYCVDTKTQRVVYWVHGSQEGAAEVADSLSEMLSGLEAPPY